MSTPNKKYRRRKYNFNSYVIFTKDAGFICETKNKEDSKLVVDALNYYHENNKDEDNTRTDQ